MEWRMLKRVGPEFTVCSYTSHITFDIYDVHHHCTPHTSTLFRCYYAKTTLTNLCDEKEKKTIHFCRWHHNLQDNLNRVVSQRYLCEFNGSTIFIVTATIFDVFLLCVRLFVLYTQYTQKHTVYNAVDRWWMTATQVIILFNSYI